MLKNLSEIIKNNQFILILLIINFTIFNISSNFQINKFKDIPYDSKKLPKLVSSPVEMNLWKKGYEFKNKNLLSNIQDHEFRHHFLPSKLLGLFGKLSGLKFYDNDKISFDGIYYFFLFQTILYYLSIIYFYKTLKNIIQNNFIIYSSVLFLLFEPTINQYRYTIFGETIFFTILIFIFSFLINLPKKNSTYLFVGLLFGICYLQRSVAMFLIIVPILILVFEFRFNSISKIINLGMSFSLILLILGYLNYNRVNIFYVLPTQTIDNLYNYFLPSVEMKRLNLKSIKDAKLKLRNEKINFAEENNLNLEKEVDRITFYQWQRNKAVNTLINNKIITFQTAIKSSLHSTLLNPTEILFGRIVGSGYYKSELHQKTIKYRIIYSLCVYILIFIGFIYTIKYKLNFPHVLLIISMYFFVISSWVGYTRYFVPSYLSLCLYFGYGTYYLYSILKRNKFRWKKI